MAPTSHLLGLGCATSRWSPMEKRSPKDETPSGRKKPSSTEGEADVEGKGSEHATTVHSPSSSRVSGLTEGQPPTPASSGRLDLDGVLVAPLTICAIRADGLLPALREAHGRAPHSDLVVDVNCYKIRRLIGPPPPHLAGRITFHRLNVKNDSRLEGLIKVSDLVWIVGEKLGEGIGSARKEAQHQAA